MDWGRTAFSLGVPYGWLVNDDSEDKRSEFRENVVPRIDFHRWDAISTKFEYTFKDGECCSGTMRRTC